MPMLLSRAAVRELDRRAIAEYGVPGVVLMENAGGAVAEWITAHHDTRSRIDIICGKGNNGGDGFVIARHLDIAGIPVRLIDFSGERTTTTSDASIMRTIAERAGLAFVHPPSAGDLEAWLLSECADAGMIVDALFGTGLARALAEPFTSVIRGMNRCGRPIIAVDVPSGLDADTGLSLGECVRAHTTITFVAGKLGFAQPSASPFLGEVVVVGIGAPRGLVDECLAGGTWTP